MSNKNFSTIMSIIALLFFLPQFVMNAQTEKSELNKKIKNIKGEVEKITIIADGEEHTFSDDEAKKLFKKLKTFKNKEVLVKVLEGKQGSGNVWFSDGEGDIDVMAFINEEHEFEFEEELEDGQKVKKEIKVEIEDGEKKVEVITTKEGKETKEVFEGEEAEEFLKKSKSNKHFNIEIYDDKDLEWVSEGDANIIFLSEETEDEGEVEKKVEVEVEDGVKKVTVTTTKDGKEEVKTYEGDEAEKYFKKKNKKKSHGYKIFKSNGNDDLIEIIIKKDGTKKNIKKIIKRKRSNDDKDK